MKKLFIHGEYMCIMNLIALPFLTMFFTQNHFVFWVLLIFLDIANFIMLDQEAMIECLIDKECRKQHHKEIMRLAIYLLAYAAIIIYLAYSQLILLALILLGNDLLESGCNVFIHKLFKHQHSTDI